MTARVATVKPGEPLNNVLKKMVTRNIGSIVVVEDNEPVGIVTERDISRCVTKGTSALKGKVKDVMSSPLFTVESTDSVQDAMAVMLKRGIRRLPVVNKQRLVGIVSERDLLRWVLRVTYESHIPPELKEIIERPVHSKK
jgi:CBS domain-containing protein